MLRLFTLTQFYSFSLLSTLLTSCSIEDKSSLTANELNIPDVTVPDASYPKYPHDQGFVLYNALSRSGPHLIGNFSTSKASACLDESDRSYIPEGEFNNLKGTECINGGLVLEFGGGSASNCANFVKVENIDYCGSGSTAFKVSVYNFHNTKTIEVEYGYQYADGSKGSETLILGPKSLQTPRCATWAGFKSCNFN